MKLVICTAPSSSPAPAAVFPIEDDGEMLSSAGAAIRDPAQDHDGSEAPRRSLPDTLWFYGEGGAPRSIMIFPSSNLICLLLNTITKAIDYNNTIYLPFKEKKHAGK